MAPMTQETLRSLIKEVAGEVHAEKMAESAAKGAEMASAPAWQQMIQQLTSKSGGSAPAANDYGRAQKPGERFFRLVGALSATMGDVEEAKKWVKGESKNAAFEPRGVFRSRSEEIERDLSSVVQAGGAVLIREEISDDFIEFLRPAQVLTALGARDIPMGSTELTIPAQTVGSTGGWLGEGEPITVTAPGFGAVTMKLHQYGSIVPIPNNLLRYAANNAEAYVSADMRNDIALAMDLADLRGSGVNAQPLGVRWSGRVTRSLGNTTDNIINDLVGCFTRAGENLMPMQKLGWGLNYRVWQRLYTIRDGIGGFLFKDEMNNGTLMGQPFKRSSVFKSNLDPYATGQFNKTELFWFDLDQVMVARGDGVAIELSREAAYEVNGVAKAAFSRDQTVVRALVGNDVGLRYRDAVQVVDGIDWIN